MTDGVEEMVRKVRELEEALGVPPATIGIMIVSREGLTKSRIDASCEIFETTLTDVVRDAVAHVRGSFSEEEAAICIDRMSLALAAAADLIGEEVDGEDAGE